MDNASKLACCLICTLAEAMKACQSCPFNPANLALKQAERIIVEKMSFPISNPTLTVN